LEFGGADRAFLELRSRGQRGFLNFDPVCWNRRGSDVAAVLLFHSSLKRYARKLF
jgi:hypothetical protein